MKSLWDCGGGGDLAQHSLPPMIPLLYLCIWGVTSTTGLRNCISQKEMVIVGIRQHWPLTLAKTGIQKREQIIRRLMTVNYIQNGSDICIPITVFNKNK